MGTYQAFGGAVAWHMDGVSMKVHSRSCGDMMFCRLKIDKRRMI